MRYANIQDAKQGFEDMLNMIQQEPVTVLQQGREVAVVLSPVDYKRMRSIKVSGFKRFCDSISDRAIGQGLSKEKLENLLRDD